MHTFPNLATSFLISVSLRVAYSYRAPDAAIRVAQHVLEAAEAFVERNFLGSWVRYLHTHRRQRRQFIYRASHTVGQSVKQVTAILRGEGTSKVSIINVRSLCTM